jgi:hypothetical protein
LSQPFTDSDILAPLDRLMRRVRWKRWLGKLHRFVWLLAAAYIALFAADAMFGMRTLGLRIVFAVFSTAAITLLAVDAAVWAKRLDLVGIAHVLEKRYPDLAERLVTLVQGPHTESMFTPLLREETTRLLASVDAAQACPLAKERTLWMRTGVLLCGALMALYFVPGFGGFAYRFLAAWATPLVPYAIDVAHGNGYALRGGNYTVEARIRIIDENVAPPTACELVAIDAGGIERVLAMNAAGTGHFTVALDDLQTSLTCSVRAGDIASEEFEVRLIDAPTFAKPPALFAKPPRYIAETGPRANLLDDANPRVLQYSKLRFELALDRAPVRAAIHLTALNGRTTALSSEEAVAVESGEYRAEYFLGLEHGLTVTLPIGSWTVYDDTPPRFIRPLRLQNGAALSAQRETRIAPNDAVKLQTEIEDDEGLGAIYLEWRVNDEHRPLEKWFDAKGQTSLSINDWLPLPSGLRNGDRVSFRAHAYDNRSLRKGEISSTRPLDDLRPQVTIAPAPTGADAEWFTLRVDAALESLIQHDAKAQADELRDTILKIKAKVLAEMAGLEPLRRATHQAAAVTPMHVQQAEKLASLNRAIVDDLRQADKRFADIDALAPLAAHFLDIADIEMKQAGDALARFPARDRAVLAAEKDLESAKDYLEAAREKLDRMLEWNKLLAQDRLDQFHLDKLAKRQDELAGRLQKLLEDPNSKNDAKAIEAIRQEQARIAAEMAKLQAQSKLVQDALAALEQARVERLAREAEQLAQDQQRMRRDATPENAPPELRDRIEQLAKQQADLADRVTPFAAKNDGPNVKPAESAVDALKKPQLEEAIAQQKEHEKRLGQWLGQLLPGVAVNSLREEVWRLHKKQVAVRLDLERLGEQLTQLDQQTLHERVTALTKRQVELPAAIAALPIAPSDERLRPAQSQAQTSTQRAADKLALKDALEAFFSMEQAEKDLQLLANLLPATLPIDRADIKDPARRARLDKVEAFQREQAKLREATEKLRGDMAKAAGAGPHPLMAKANKLASEVQELSQRSGNPDAKAMAKESANAIDQAKKAMEASQAMKAKGDPDQAKHMDDQAARMLYIAVKQMAKLAQNVAMKKVPRDLSKAAEAIQQSADQMRKAEGNLPAMPKDAQAAMKAAAKSLAQAAKDVQQQMSSRLPQPARNPAAKSTIPLAGGMPSSLPKELQAELLKARNWGELSGELKTQMIQDYSTRFGPDHAEVIRLYFERLSATPLPK